MQPWRADWILHIGVEPSFTADGQSNEPRLKILGKYSEIVAEYHFYNCILCGMCQELQDLMRSVVRFYIYNGAE